MHSLGPVLSADAAHLIAAEGNFGLIAVGVEEDVACLQLLRNPMTLSNVIRPNIAGQSVVRIVGHANCFIEIGIRSDAKHRTEEFVASNGHIGVTLVMIAGHMKLPLFKSGR